MFSGFRELLWQRRNPRGRGQILFDPDIMTLSGGCLLSADRNEVKTLAGTINAVNERTGNTEKVWEYRSFKERELDIIPEVHLGAKVCALENKGVRTERGGYGRDYLTLYSKRKKFACIFLSF